MTAAPSLLDYTIRAAEPGDRRFIIETTAKVRQPRDVTWTDWRDVGERQAAHALDDGAACVASADGVIVGYSLFVVVPALLEMAVHEAVEMLYVKRDFRGCGIGRSLLREALPETLAITRATPSWRRWARLHRIRWEEVR